MGPFEVCVSEDDLVGERGVLVNGLKKQVSLMISFLIRIIYEIDQSLFQGRE